MKSTAPAPIPVERIVSLLAEHFPDARVGEGAFVIERVGGGEARVRMPRSHQIIRPGGTVSGPSMFMLADLAVYVAILGALGDSALQAVTSSMTLHFLKRPLPGDMITEVKLLRLGRRVAVAEAALYSDGDGEIVAHATAAYAIPTAASRPA